MSDEQTNRSAVLLEFGFLWDKMADEIVELRARLAAAERDAARYAFLRDNLVSVEYYVPFLSNDDLRCSVKTFGKRSANMPTLDEAIDALATPTTTEDV